MASRLNPRTAWELGNAETSGLQRLDGSIERLDVFHVELEHAVDLPLVLLHVHVQRAVNLHEAAVVGHLFILRYARVDEVLDLRRGAVAALGDGIDEGK